MTHFRSQPRQAEVDLVSNMQKDSLNAFRLPCQFGLQTLRLIQTLRRSPFGAQVIAMSDWMAHRIPASSKEGRNSGARFSTH